MAFSFEGVWRDLKSLWFKQGDVAFAIIGVFVFLPSFAQLLFTNPPEIDQLDWNGVRLMMDYYSENALPLLLVRVVSLVGGGALLFALLAPPGADVAQAIKRAAILLPSLFVLSIAITLLVSAGLIAFIIPGLYLIARAMLAEAVMMVENVRNPVTAIARSFELTAGQGWRLLGLFVLVMVMTWLGIQIVAIVTTVLSKLLFSDSGVHATAAAMGAVSNALFTLVAAMLSATLYRQLSNKGM